MTEHPPTFSDRMRARTRGLTGRVGAALHKAGVHPDWITVAGLLLVFIAAVFIARGQHQLGAVILILGLPLDALDGAIARAMQRQDKFGEVLDSAFDRFADGLIFSAIGYYFASQNQLNYLLLAFAALVGSISVSYIRARAGEVNVKMKVGLFTRFERLITILIALLVPPLLVPGMVVLAVGTNVTAFQRLWFAYNHLMK